MGTRTGNSIKIVNRNVSSAVPQSVQSEPNPTAVYRNRGFKLHPVESSNVEAIGYNSKTFELGVKFKNNDTVYISPGVPEYVYRDFENAPSKGSFFARHIKGQYL